ncbi:protein GlmU [Desulfosarcina sp.]|uniref:protein GlmU n=1 Tax=Desulfosarcina sp. TaxID=2027861 RepID=UPI003970C5DA
MDKLQQIVKKGARVPDPHGVVIGDEVDVNRIAGEGVVLYPGTRIQGSRTFIAPGVRIGAEGPATLDNCHVGPRAALKGGFFSEAVFLADASCGLGAHVRQGTILEEGASIAHTVGLKQTILFPFVTLGSLINFCDCLMAGGSSRKDHSEVGSSYIHFNYTPNQDKATASLIGDVPNGVMLNQPPIFLGGQGGLVGPCRIAYGTVIAAGSIYRKDQLKPGRLIIEGGGRGGSVPYSKGIYRNVKRQAFNNIVYMANLVALMSWYTHVRRQFVGERFPQSLHEGLIDTLRLAIDERIQRFTSFCEKLDESKTLYRQQMGDSASSDLINQKNQLIGNRDQAGDLIRRSLDSIETFENKAFLSIVLRKIDSIGPTYIDVIKSLDAGEALQGTVWLQQVVDEITGQVLNLFPAIR